jgi:phosphopantetheine adenylyltransferase
MEGINKKIEELQSRFLDLKNLLNIDSKKKHLSQIQIKMNEAGFWDNQKEAVVLSKEAEELTTENITWSKLGDEIEDLF